MTKAEIICRNSFGMWDMSTARKMRDGVNKLTPIKFEIYACRICTKYHLQPKGQEAKA